jgi:unsaturated rhamnogalacturonyl hydrolase
MVKSDQFIQGLAGSDGEAVFMGSYDMYLKEVSTIEVNAPAKALVKKDGETLIAVARYGKGRVLAVGDPWLYNEYVDGRKALPPSFQNYRAAEDLVKWLLKK